MAIDVARRVPEALRAWDEDGSRWDSDSEFWRQARGRISELLTASTLADAERRTAESLLLPYDGIILGHMAGDRQLSYTGGIHGAHARLIAGVQAHREYPIPLLPT